MRADKGRHRRATGTGEKIWRAERLIPYGTSTMPDEEFWGRVRATSALLDEAKTQKGTGSRSGQ